jgi:hypothetical protein
LSNKQGPASKTKQEFRADFSVSLLFFVNFVPGNAGLRGVSVSSSMTFLERVVEHGAGMQHGKAMKVAPIFKVFSCWDRSPLNFGFVFSLSIYTCLQIL